MYVRAPARRAHLFINAAKRVGVCMRDCRYTIHIENDACGVHVSLDCYN
jgi:hypothetical protein